MAGDVHIPIFPPHTIAAIAIASVVSVTVSALTSWPVGVTVAATAFAYWSLLDRGRRVQAALLQQAWDRYERENVAWRLRNLPADETREEGFRRLGEWLEDAGIDTSRSARELLLDEHAPGEISHHAPFVFTSTSSAESGSEIEPGAPTYTLPEDEAARRGSEHSSSGGGLAVANRGGA